MGIIKRLDPGIANKIAAGEVVEKLANVVKELVENSIDAESTKIDIDLIDSGMKSIRVTDNGFGMSEDDAVLAFERHATSKIKTVNDLFRIQSLGFRGEALPSIAAISRVELSTSNGKDAVKIVFEDGKMLEKANTSMNQGTMIEVTKLFYSTPARFKYLKSPQYELASIVAMINGFALANPSISFRLTNDRKQIFVSKSNDSLTNLLSQIYGIQAGKSLIYFEAENRDYHIYGYTTNPIVNRSSRNYINIVVNNRIISNADIVKAITESYDQLIPKGRYPITLLYIEVDPLLIDVNIHPRKQEIKFSEKDKLINLIKRALKEKLEVTYIYQKPSEDYSQTKITFFEEESTYNHDYKIKQEVKKDLPQKVDVKVIADMEYIGQFSGTYLLWQNEEGLYLLDQHAAAERIRYEKYLAKWLGKSQETNELLIPLSIEISNDMLLKLREHETKIKDLGVELEIKDNHVLAKTIPNWFPKGFEEIYVESMIMNLLEDDQATKEQLVDDLAKLLACKHSLKANHYISNLEANQLLSDLRKCKRPFTCPHGRPIIVDISINTIEHWFNRVI
ncbi:MAG: DNA mismatch repair endonuclease MutL [Candidatus Izemoplasmatales bacterium]|jgi:DNA mismatch repair protein MutL|nr:DNA mismatch repair endonuclease MutL [Candidatus Izemoplasmatales bacterium]